MSDPNPYQPPRPTEPLATGPAIKRGIGMGVILLLTPFATFAAFFTSCAATYLLAFSVDANWSGFIVAVLIFGPPAIVFVGMLVWAFRARRRHLRMQAQAQRQE